MNARALSLSLQTVLCQSPDLSLPKEEREDCFLGITWGEQLPKRQTEGGPSPAILCPFVYSYEPTRPISCTKREKEREEREGERGERKERAKGKGAFPQICYGAPIAEREDWTLNLSSSAAEQRERGKGKKGFQREDREFSRRP